MTSLNEWLKTNQIMEVECVIPDITGNGRGKIIPAGKFIKEESRLPESILIQSVTGESTELFNELVSPLDADMYLMPDENTKCKIPWANQPTAQIIHDCYTRDGKPHPLATRNILKKV